jgi:hypothetical protein
MAKKSENVGAGIDQQNAGETQDGMDLDEARRQNLENIPDDPRKEGFDDKPTRTP